MQRLAAPVTPTNATAKDCFVAVNLGDRMPGLGRLPAHTTDR
jgi:hypothetical protein